MYELIPLMAVLSLIGDAVAMKIHAIWIMPFSLFAGLFAIALLVYATRRDRLIAENLLSIANLKDPYTIGICRATFAFEGTEFGTDLGILCIDTEFVHFDGWQTYFGVSGNEFVYSHGRRELVLKNAPGYHVRLEQLPAGNTIAENLPSIDWSEAHRKIIAVRHRKLQPESHIRLPPKYPNPHGNPDVAWLKDRLPLLSWFAAFLGFLWPISGRLLAVSPLMIFVWIAVVVGLLSAIKREWRHVKTRQALRDAFGFEMQVEAESGG